MKYHVSKCHPLCHPTPAFNQLFLFYVLEYCKKVYVHKVLMYVSEKQYWLVNSQELAVLKYANYTYMYLDGPYFIIQHDV